MANFQGKKENGKFVVVLGSRYHRGGDDPQNLCTTLGRARGYDSLEAARDAAHKLNMIAARGHGRPAGGQRRSARPRQRNPRKR